MTLLFYVLLTVGLAGVADPVVYMLAELRYKKNSELEKSNWFEVQSVVFRFKYAKAVYIAVGVICLAAAVMIHN